MSNDPRCPYCRRDVQVPANFAGGRITCPNCYRSFPIAHATSEAAPYARPAPTAKPARWLVWLLLGVPVGLVFLCCGGFGLVSMYTSYHAGKEIESADQLYAAGQRAEAVAKYKEWWSYAGSRQAEAVQRIVEHELEQDNDAEARKWMEQALDRRLEVAYESPTARDLFESVKVDWEDRQARAEEERASHGAQPPRPNPPFRPPMRPPPRPPRK
jgi:hypothetical protein